MRETTEAIVGGAVTGTPAAPTSLLLDRFDDESGLQYVGRTTTLTRTASRSPGC
ncbi:MULTISPECIES: hypothetical protein [unclassified Streptomyces]|uniref:hypothetical protein n=1 Tax=unclassified Streptomyces TaxID=2593676 RepID=UPI002E28A3E2|nr:hypothetical protein [Streptomyces sp. NBC_00228]